MLLGPQHFQQLSLRVESLLRALPGQHLSFPWGVRHFEYNPGDLTGGVVTVAALDAVMPDGTHVELQDPLQLDLRPMAGSLRQKAWPIHLALPVGAGLSGDTPRFVSHPGDLVPDENTGDAGVVIPRLRPRLSLIASVEPPPSRYTSFPLLEVRCEGEAFLPTEFTPPALLVSSTSPIGRQCASISERLRRKAAMLAERAMLMPQTQFASDARIQLTALGSALPAFEALLRVEPPPLSLYLELCRLAGAVAVIGNSLVPPLFPAYVHNDSRRAFDEVARFVVRSVDEGVPDQFERYAFEQEGEAFRLTPDPGWTGALAAGSRARVVLAVQSDASDELALGWGANCVIGSRSRIRSLLSRRILGLPRRAADRAGELPARRGTVLFDVTTDAEAFAPEDDLIVLGSAPGVRPTALFLYVFDAGLEQGHG